MRYSQDGDVHVTGIVSSSEKAPSSPTASPARAEAVNFSLSVLHSIREAPLHKSKRSVCTILECLVLFTLMSACCPFQGSDFLLGGWEGVADIVLS